MSRAARPLFPRLERWLLTRFKRLQAQRLAGVIKQLQAGAKSVTVPGKAEHASLVERYITAAYTWGRYHAWLEVQRLRAAADQFNIPTPPHPRGPVPVDAVSWAAARVELQGKWERDLDAKVNAVIVESIEQGLVTRDIVKKLKAVFPEFGRSRLENIARTETASAYNAGRLAGFLRSKFVAAVQFTAILDDRTSPMCTERDGKIMLLDDPALASNTPPLHFQCRSTIVGLDKYDLADLRVGVKEIEERFFGWVRPGGPKNWAEASDWSNLPNPLPGFGGRVPAPIKKPAGKPKPPKSSTPARPRKAKAAKPPAKLKQKVTAALGTNPGLADLKAAGKLLRENILAGPDRSNWGAQVLDSLSEVRDFGGGPKPVYQPRVQQRAKDALERVHRFLPDDWAAELAKRPVGAKLLKRRARYDLVTRTVEMNGDEEVTLHEVGHWLEDTASASPTGFFAQSVAYLKSRTAGEPLRSLRRLTGNNRYRTNEVTRTDAWDNIYIGKAYEIAGRVYATEILSMGIQRVFYKQRSKPGQHWWDSDPDFIDFILGCLVYCKP